MNNRVSSTIFFFLNALIAATTASEMSSYPLSETLPLDLSLKMIPLDLPTKDFDSTADDLHFCKELNYCSHNGRCNVEESTCICDTPWSGTECDQGSYETLKGNHILITELNHKTMTRDDRADGNELFLAKAHHRLRQVVAELSLKSESNEELVGEKYHLMRSLGMLYTSVGFSAHELTLGLEPAKVAARHPSQRRLPNVMTMRWKSPVPSNDEIKDAIQSTFENALKHEIVSGRAKKEVSLSSEDGLTNSHFGVFNQRGGGAIGDRDLEKITGANSTTTIASENTKDDNAPVRNINHEDEWNTDHDKSSVLDVNHEMTDMLPGLELLYSLPTTNDDEAQKHNSNDNDTEESIIAVPTTNVQTAFNKDLENALKLQENHKAKELIVNQKIGSEVNAEEVKFKDVTNTT